MSSIRIDLDCVQVTDGQGAGEGNFELNIEVLETFAVIGGNISRRIWPHLGGTEKVNNNGAVTQIGDNVAYYTVTAPVYKAFKVVVTEEDTGTLGQDEVGQADLSFHLTPDMGKISKSVYVTLKNQGRNEGQVKVILSAQPD